MLSILYLILESIAIILPILLAVAFIYFCLLIWFLTRSNFLNIRLWKWAKLFIFTLFLFVLINNSLFTIFSSIENIYIFISNLIFNASTLIIKVWFNFLSYCTAIISYSFTSNWASTFLLSVLPVKFKANFSSTPKSMHLEELSKNTKDSPVSPLNPWFVTGFTDGEGSFYFSIVESETRTVGWAITIGFNLVAKNNPANLAMLKSIVKFFGVEQIITAKSDSYIRLIINGLQNCLIIRDHFINFPLLTLLTFKLVHFKLWCAVIDLLVAKEHLTLFGLLKIIALKAHSPLGLSEKLILAFPNFLPINCPDYNPDFTLMNIHWLAGFMNADGSFGKNKTNGAFFRFRIAQNIRSLAVMYAIAEFLGEGNSLWRSRLNVEF